MRACVRARSPKHATAARTGWWYCTHGSGHANGVCCKGCARESERECISSPHAHTGALCTQALSSHHSVEQLPPAAAAVWPA